MLPALLLSAAQALGAAASPAAAAPAPADPAAAPVVPSPSTKALSPAAASFVEEATRRLIAGEELAPDFPVRLQALAPDERLLVIVHLRRAGYLADVVMPVEWVISPAVPLPDGQR